MNQLLRISRMTKSLEKAPSKILPSKHWITINNKNIEEIKKNGLKNFKRTIARDYFTWIGNSDGWQVRYLINNISFYRSIRAIIKSLIGGRHKDFSWTLSMYYNILTFLLWEYVDQTVPMSIQKQLSESRIGNPPPIFFKNKLVSQDLGNSIVEYKSIIDCVDLQSIKIVLELGAGYGRDAFVFLKLNPNLRYIIVDIPPALYVSETYLSKVFPKMKIFKFKDFKDFAQVKNDFERSQLIFLLPNQLKMLPKKQVDLFINISSFHEMRLDQINYYFKEVERLTKGYFYFKQWKKGLIPSEGLVIRESDYPVRKKWSKIYWRTCKVQTLFFEALYKV